MLIGRDGGAQTKLLKIGVADLLNQFPQVNDSISGATIEEMEQFVAGMISNESFDTDYDFALFTGELRFEKLSGYPLAERAIHRGQSSVSGLNGRIHGRYQANIFRYDDG